MSELISRQKLIERLKKWKNNLDEWDYRDYTLFGVYEDIMDIIKSQPPADQWIPCSERLPHNFDDVIITTNTGNTEVGWYNKILEKWFSDNMIVNVTAWMPLPEPYKGEQNDR